MVANPLASIIEAGLGTDYTPWQIVPRRSDDATTDLFTVDGRTVYLNMHDGQWRTWHSEARFVFMLAGSQGGKTSWAPWWLFREIQRLGRGDYMAISSNFPLFDRKMLPEIKRVFINTLGIGRYYTQARVMEIANLETGEFEGDTHNDPRCWARIMLGSADAASGLESATANAVWADECGQKHYTVNIFEALEARLSLAEGRFLGTTTLYNVGALKQNYYDPHRRGEAPDVDIIQFASTLNPSFSEDEFDRQREKLPTWKFLMRYKGEYARPAGMIYNDFIDDYRERGGHKVAPFEIPRDWHIFCGVDPGIINTAKLWIAWDYTHDLYYLFREEIGPRKPQTEHATEALEFAARRGFHVRRWFIGAKSEKYHRQDWLTAGAKGVKEPPIDDVEAGIDACIALLKAENFYIFDTCKGFLEQIATYSREVDDMGEPTDKIKDKSAYHYLDAWRYFALGVRPTKRRGLPTATTRRYLPEL